MNFQILRFCFNIYLLIVNLYVLKINLIYLVYLIVVVFQIKRKCFFDVGFVIDGLRSVEVFGKGNFKKMLDFVKNVFFGFNIFFNDMCVGVISYGVVF